MIKRIIPPFAVLVLTACASPPGGNTPEDTPEDPVAEVAADTCWHETAAPATVPDTADEPAQEAAGDEDEARPTADEERKVTRFETPCPDDLTPDFIASLQRALHVRELYSDAITGEMNDQTRAAIRRFQQPDGPDSSTLSLAAARELGLVAVERPEVDAPVTLPSALLPRQPSPTPRSANYPR